MDDMDPIERRMDCRVEDMTAAELATYIKTYLYEVHDIDLPMERHRGAQDPGGIPAQVSGR